MKTIMPFVLLFAVSAVFEGCATSQGCPAVNADFRRTGLITDPNDARRIERAMTDSEIADMLSVNVKAHLPSAVAVAKLGSHYYDYRPSLEAIDAEEMQSWQKALERRPHVVGALPVTQMAYGEKPLDMRSLRAAAARMNCELLLVYLQADSEVDNYNDAAVLYWTIIGMWAVPGNVIEHKTVMQAILVDCRTGMILGAASGDSHLKRTYPAAFKDQRQAELNKLAPAEALADLQKGCSQMITQTVTAALAKNR